MYWTPQKKYKLSEWSENEYNFPFRNTPAAKTVFMSTEYKQGLYPELSYLYPGFKKLYERYIVKGELAKAVFCYIESCIVELERAGTCSDKLFCEWWIGNIDDTSLTQNLENRFQAI